MSVRQNSAIIAGGNQIDNVPTSGSTNPVSSGGVYTALSGKADIDLSNAASNASTTAKQTIIGWSMPSETYENISLGPNGVQQLQHYTAPADGYAFINSAYHGQSSAFVRMTVRPSGNQSDSNYYASEHFFYNSSGTASLLLPVKKGADVELYYTMTWGAESFFKFIYAQGEV